jgi:hypothetical protein
LETALMKGSTRMPELSDAYLRGLAEGNALARDPAAMHKAQQARERDAILRVCRENVPLSGPATIDEAKARVAELSTKLADAKVAYRKWDGRSLDPAAQKELQEIARIGDDLRWAERHVADMQNAAAQREAAGVSLREEG